MAEETGGDIWSSDKADNKQVNEFHTNDDVDVDRNSHHHTLGPNSNQAAPGNHRHNGEDSALLFEGEAITGSIANGTALRSVIALLTTLGAEDSTGP